MEINIHQIISDLCSRSLKTNKLYNKQYKISDHNNNKLKNLRSKIYNLLLNYSKTDNNTFGGITDVTCQLLVCQLEFQAKNENCKLDQLRQCMDKIDIEAHEKIIKFILLLKDDVITEEYETAPTLFDNIINNNFNETRNNELYHQFSSDDFTLVSPIRCIQSQPASVLENNSYLLKTSIDSFSAEPGTLLNPLLSSTNSSLKAGASNFSFSYIQTEETKPKPIELVNQETKCEQSKDVVLEQDNTRDTRSVWEIIEEDPLASYELLSNEKPFLTEGKSDVVHLIWSLPYKNVLFPEKKIIAPPLNFIEIEPLMEDVKNLIVGLPSTLFTLSRDGNSFKIKSGLCTKEIAVDSMQHYLHDFVVCGTLYRNLQMVTCAANASGKLNDFIYRELCTSVTHFLYVYRTTVVFSPIRPDLLTIHKNTRTPRFLLQLVAQLLGVKLEVGDHNEVSIIRSPLPKGVCLLKRIYTAVLLADRNDSAYLLSCFLCSCLQTFLRRFLQPWIFDGIVDDPDGEFFIEKNTKYMYYENRRYWTHGFYLKFSDSQIPNFFENLIDSILKCGKMVNFIKRCAPDSSVCYFLMNESVQMKIVQTSKQCENLKQYYLEYYDRYLEICGKPMTVNDYFTKRKEHEINLQRRALRQQNKTLERLKSELQKKRQYLANEKLQLLTEYLEHKNAVESYKESERLKEQVLELERLEKIKKADEQTLLMYNEEKENLEEYYDGLSKLADKKLELAQKRTEHLRLILENQTESYSKSNYDNVPPKVHTQNADNLTTPTNNNLIIPTQRQIIESEIPVNNNLVLIDSTESSRSNSNLYRTVNQTENLVTPTNNNNSLISNVLNNDQNRRDISAASKLTEKEETTFEAARRIKAKVLSLELGIQGSDVYRTNRDSDAVELNEESEFERNRRRILSRSNQYDANDKNADSNLPETELERNRKRILSRSSPNNKPIEESSKTFLKLDNCVDSNLQSDLETNKERISNAAKLNKLKIMAESDMTEIKSSHKVNKDDLTDLEKNRLKVMTCEYNLVSDKSAAKTAVDEKPTFTRRRWCYDSNSEDNSAAYNAFLARENKRKVLQSEFGMFQNQDIKEPAPAMNTKALEKLYLNINASDLSLPSADTFTDTGMITGKVESDKVFPFPEKIFNYIDVENFKFLHSRQSDIEFSTENVKMTVNLFDTKNKSFELMKPIICEQLNNYDEHPLISPYELKYKSILVKPDDNEKNIDKMSSKEGNTVSKEITGNISNTSETEGLSFFLRDSVFIPLNMQMKILHSSVLNYFLTDVNILSHLESIRNYFFFADGEFSRNLINILFTQLYEANKISDILNVRRLHNIMIETISECTQTIKHSDHLSFKIDNEVQEAHLTSVNLLDCLSLVYRIDWPLNIVLPNDIMLKYDRVFKYLIKIRRVWWILEDVFQELKLLSKEKDFDEALLQKSPQYKNLQLLRHIMVSWISALYRYLTSVVFSASQVEFETELKKATSIDDIFETHRSYIKAIIFRCLLNEKSAPIMKVINEVFASILKFHNFLVSMQWTLNEGDEFYTHPNYKKMLNSYSNFKELAKYVYKIGSKLVRVGYQPHLVQLLDILNVNGYYDDVDLN